MYNVFLGKLHFEGNEVFSFLKVFFSYDKLNLEIHVEWQERGRRTT
ncbi:hypothetical protein bmyco0003_14380 [Bacillus pseudomycoides]|nr:hypothetical protein bmyco0002_14840 [Bacillus pseudomycoides]EEM11827.1 hypothetical protein bmyco0003_14380 [Bacillus pseudomycoides]EEM17880.1 hypothetical protein bpmyx0001_15180 [Bacillus pseudomycoides DSM 12442]